MLIYPGLLLTACRDSCRRFNISAPKIYRFAIPWDKVRNAF